MYLKRKKEKFLNLTREKKVTHVDGRMYIERKKEKKIPNMTREKKLFMRMVGCTLREKKKTIKI